MVNLSYEDLNNQYHFRVADSSSRTSFDLIDGIQPLSITGKTFPAHSVSEITRGIHFPGLTIDNITSHIRVWVREPPTWQVQWKNSMLISASDKLMWAVWEAIRRLAKVKYNAGDITMFVILKRCENSFEDDIIQASACEILANFSGEEVKEANNFARSSSEQLYFQRIPVKLIKAKKVFTLRGLLNWLPQYYFSTPEPRLRSGRVVSELVFNTTDSFYVAQSKILARKDELEDTEEETLMDLEEIDQVTLVGSPRESSASSQVHDSANLAAMLQAPVIIKDKITQVEGCLKELTPEPHFPSDL